MARKFAYVFVLVFAAWAATTFGAEYQGARLRVTDGEGDMGEVTPSSVISFVKLNFESCRAKRG